MYEANESEMLMRGKNDIHVQIRWSYLILLIKDKSFKQIKENLNELYL